MKIKGYKASYKGICRGHLYEVGHTYNIDNIYMCERGFHFCKEIKNVFKYYLYNKDFVLFEVIGSGEMNTSICQMVCGQIEIVRIVPKEEYPFPVPLYEYDQNRNVIHYKDLNVYEYWQTYDTNNNLIHYKNSFGNEYRQTFDEKNNRIHLKHSDGWELWNTYDMHNNSISFKYLKEIENVN